MDESMQVVWMKPGDLIPYQKNAKTHPPEQIERIKASIKNFRWTQPIVVDENNVVVIGHGRLQAAIELHQEKVPVVKRYLVWCKTSERTGNGRSLLWCHQAEGCRLYGGTQ